MASQMNDEHNDLSSAGHKLGQLVGLWFEEYFVQPLLSRVAEKLYLFLDNPFIDRPARGDKIVWKDEYGNFVDYDFVLELGGTTQIIGIPVAFVECFWRRGSRHSKDKARDDSGKLIPMRDTYPTARFLGIVAAGHFTGPAKELIRNRDIDLFYVPKDKVIEAFMRNDLVMDYLDRATEVEKSRVATIFEAGFTENKKRDVASTLINLVGQATVNSYVDRVRARLSALPQEIRIVIRHEAEPLTFSSVEEVTAFLRNPSFQMVNPKESYVYQITYSDGLEFERIAEDIQQLNHLHDQMQALSNHINNLQVED